MTIEERAEKAFRAFVKQVGGNIPGPSSTYESGYMDGLRHYEFENPPVITYRLEVYLTEWLGVKFMTESTSDKRKAGMIYESLVKKFGKENVRVLKIHSVFGQRVEEVADELST